MLMKLSWKYSFPLVVKPICFLLFSHSHSMAVFTYYDIMDKDRNKIAEGHKASFCLEDSECKAGVKKK